TNRFNCFLIKRRRRDVRLPPADANADDVLAAYEDTADDGDGDDDLLALDDSDPMSSSYRHDSDAIEASELLRISGATRRRTGSVSSRASGEESAAVRRNAF